ncbi:MAG TPA: trypsin-like peptidase domain-containing protein [Candidatus Woesebacteria bacterium]|jgi:S1-C subfamily serine protease|nr:trypsin-like peptidase domain-containing protein [Candidatus Woesebacteria bacterium]
MKKNIVFVVLVLLAFAGGVYLSNTGQIEKILPNSLGEKVGTEDLTTDHRITSFSDDQLSISEVVEAVGPSVVTISAERNVLRPGSFSFSPFGFGSLFEQFYQSPSEEDFETIEQDIGTGFVVLAKESNQLFVITNRHVVSDFNLNYLVYDYQDQVYEVTDIYRDPVNDLAILNVKDLNLPALTLGDSDQIKIGESVIAIGTALGQFRNTVTSGIISGVGRGITASNVFGGQQENLDNIIQTDAAINPGNSGGPLINARGEVIGVNVATSAGADNIGFALPINLVKNSLANFEATGKFDRAVLGVAYTLISEQAAIVNEVPQGAYIQEVFADSNAERGGLQVGDIITKFNGQKITETETLPKLLNETRVGSEVELEIWRKGKKETLKITLEKSNS